MDSVRLEGDSLRELFKNDIEKILCIPYRNDISITLFKNKVEDFWRILNEKKFLNEQTPSNAKKLLEAAREDGVLAVSIQGKVEKDFQNLEIW